MKIAKMAEVVPQIAAALPLAFLIYYVNDASNLVHLAFCLIISAFFVCVVCFLLKMNRAFYEKKRVREDFIEHLYRIISYKARGGSYLKAVENAAKHAETKSLGLAAQKASRRLLLGGDYLEPVVSIEELKSYAPIQNSRTDPKDMIRSHYFHIRSNYAEIENAAQRYATFNMFISTILPSFLVFAFIGNAILAQSTFSMLVFSLFLLIVLPLAYSVGNLLMWRRLLA